MYTFERTKNIRMQHCDPAGIVFTPQYFNLFIETIEDWFSLALNYNFHQMIVIEKSGIPAMRILARFYKPSFLGEEILFKLKVKRIRTTTALITIVSEVNSEKRCYAEFLYGFSRNINGSLSEWPIQVKENMLKYYNP